MSSLIALPFRPRARLLQLLGDQLIGSPRLAVFELVKNAYDADASRVSVQLDLADQTEASLSVEDDGEGMSLDTIKNVWLVPGDDHRQKQREQHRRTPRFGRLPLGEKGVGRFAAHKLGDRITVTTRAKGEQENVVTIDWDLLLRKRFLSDAEVEIETRKPQLFKGNTSGTFIKIERLRPPIWSRGEVRRLYRQIVSMSSPFEGPADFKSTLTVPGRKDWMEDLPEVGELLRQAFWRFDFEWDGDRYNWSYVFKPSGFKIEGRKLDRKKDRLLLPIHAGSEPVADADTLKGIGPVHGRYFIFDRDKDVLSRLANRQQLTQFLDEQGGVRVYRDGIRVYNYGEPSDDWLGLDLRRVNKPTRGISRNLIVGAIELSLETSDALVEKTNREGFVENAALSNLRNVILGTLTTFEAERKPDKDRLRQASGAAPILATSSIEASVGDLKVELKKVHLLEKFEPLVDRIERSYSELKENLLRPSATGLNLAIIFHEVERGVRAIHKSVHERESPSQIERQTRDLMQMLDGFSVLLRRDNKRVHSLKELLEQALRFNRLRFKHHSIELFPKTVSAEADKLKAKFSMNLALGAVSNLIDNAIYWTRVRWPDGKKAALTRRIFVGTSSDLSEGPALIVADSGTGFQDAPATVVQPFFTRKPDGMGLGLYYSNLVMELNEGKLMFPEPSEVELPDGFDGAVVALVFQGTE